MRKKIMEFFNLKRFTSATIFMVSILILFPLYTNASPQDQEILLYTLKADPTVKIGYPRGWAVQENQAGVFITEKQTNDSAGVLVFLGRLQPNVRTKEALAKTMLNALRQMGYPDLKVVKQQNHPQASDVLTIDATLSAEGIPFQAHMWCAADTNTNIGIFSAFYAPKQRYNTFNIQKLLGSCLAPMFSGKGTTQGASGHANQNTNAITSGITRDIIFIRQEGENRILCAYNPSTGRITKLYNFKDLPVCQPGRSLDGNTIALALPAIKRIFCITNIQRFDRSLSNNVTAFPMIYPLSGEAHVNSPSISRDGQLVAVQIRTFQYAGRTDVHDATSGAYSHSHTAILRRSQLASYKFQKSIQQQVLYYKDPMVPDVMTNRRGWCPVFCPTNDIVAYTYGEKLCLHNSKSGSKLKEIKLTYPINELSSIAFSPDGSVIAYISSSGISGSNYSIVFMDIRNGVSKGLGLPKTIRPSSAIQDSSTATLCLDFSPDARYIVFSAAQREGEPDSAVEMFNDLAGNPSKQNDLYVLEIQSGNCKRLTYDGKNFDPVWKGH